MSNISFGRVKDTSQGDVSFTHPKHMLLQTVIKIDHQQVFFSKSSVSKIYFELAIISKISTFYWNTSTTFEWLVCLK